MIVAEDVFKGNKILSIKKDEDDKYPFNFGIGKAKKILACIPDIEKFVKDNETKDPPY